MPAPTVLMDQHTFNGTGDWFVTVYANCYRGNSLTEKYQLEVYKFVYIVKITLSKSLKIN